MRTPIIIVLVLAAGVAVAVAARTHGPPEPAACTLATVGDLPITSADAAELTGLLSPPPSPAEAGRLAVDVALAQWIVRGYIAPASAARRLASYRELLAQLGTRSPDRARAAVAALARAAERVGVEPGPCLVPAARSPGALPAVGDADLAALVATPAATRRRLAERAHGRPILAGIAWRMWPGFARIPLGPVLADELEPALGTALAATAPGAFSPAVTAQSGVYVVQRTE